MFYYSFLLLLPLASALMYPQSSPLFSLLFLCVAVAMRVHMSPSLTDDIIRGSIHHVGRESKIERTRRQEHSDPFYNTAGDFFFSPKKK